MVSYFVTYKSTALQMMESEDVYLLTPSRMNPYCDSYATNEENMLDCEGNMIQRKDRVRILLSDIQEDVAMAASVQVSSAEAKAIDTCLETSGAAYDEEAHPCWEPIPRAADEISSVLAGVSPTLDDQILYGRLIEQADLGRFKASIGSTNASRSEYLVETVDDESSTDDDMSASESDEEEDLEELYERATQGKIDLDEILMMNPLLTMT